MKGEYFREEDEIPRAKGLLSEGLPQPVSGGVYTAFPSVWRGEQILAVLGLRQRPRVHRRPSFSEASSLAFSTK